MARKGNPHQQGRHLIGLNEFHALIRKTFQLGFWCTLLLEAKTSKFNDKW